MAGLETTFRTLATTSNEAATRLLIGALDSANRNIQEAAIRTLLERRSTDGYRELLRRWSALGARWQALLAERSERLCPTLRAMLGEADRETSASAAAAAVAMREYDAMPTLVSVAESRAEGISATAARALLALADLLYDELANPRNYRERRDPHLVHQHVTTALEGAIGRAERHHPELLEAFVLLAKSDNGVLRGALEQPRHPAHEALREILLTSPRPGVMNKILRLFERSTAPSLIIDVFGQRRDVPFLRRASKLLEGDARDVAQRNLRRVTQLRWLDDLHVLQALNDGEQQAMMEIAALTSTARDDVFRTVQFLLKNGTVGGRRAAALALAEFSGADANALALEALDDSDPIVQSHIVRQVRSRNLAGAMRRLILLIDHPHEQVRLAARESLAEFNFQRYLAAYEILTPEVRKTTGALVKKVDPDTVPQLAAELASPSRIRRMRALQIAPVMNVVEELETQIVALMGDDDHFIRAEAARALGASGSPLAQHTLRRALDDRSQLVKEAAEQALAATGAPAELAAPIDSRYVMLPNVTPPVVDDATLEQA